MSSAQQVLPSPQSALVGASGLIENVWYRNLQDLWQRALFGTGTGEVRGCAPLHNGGDVPAGWLQCDGSAVSRSTYRNLFLAIGVAFGIGDGTTTFNLPTVTFGSVPFIIKT